LTTMLATRNFSSKNLLGSKKTTDAKENSDSSTMDETDDTRNRKAEIIKLTEMLLGAITSGNYEEYCRLCDPALTCFEPEARGHLVEGMEFHKFYFDNVLSNQNRSINTTVVNPHVHLLGEDSAAIAYNRLTQFVDKSGQPQTMQCEETRIWQRKDIGWVVVHLHRSGGVSAPTS